MPQTEGGKTKKKRQIESYTCGCWHWHSS